METTWVVIADAARARVFERSGPSGSLAEIVDLTHPASRSKGSELGRDRPGHVEVRRQGPGNASFDPHTDPQAREHDRFAREVAQVLDEAIGQGRCKRLVLVASDPFLGRVRGHLGPQTLAAVRQTVAHDYCLLGVRELQARLNTLLVTP